MLSEDLHNLKILQIGELGCKVVEGLLEALVHLRGTTDPELLASSWETLLEETLVPAT
jgi:hypothetical protein